MMCLKEKKDGFDMYYLLSSLLIFGYIYLQNRVPLYSQ